jgi:predicted ArsR family transcriptional regulator
MSGIPSGTEELTRERLVRLLRYRPHTVDELAIVVGLTRNGVRVQLALLERDGVVARVGVRHGDGPGKPPQLYRVTAEAEASFSAAHAPALDALVAILGERLERPELHAVFNATGRRLAATRSAGSKGDPAGQARAVLESLGAAVTVRREGGHQLVEGVACPLAEAVRRCPDSCEMVRALLAAATGARVATRCQHDAAPRCRFAVS